MLISGKKITILLSLEYFCFQFIINKYKTIWIILRLEVMIFSNLEGEKINFVFECGKVHFKTREMDLFSMYKIELK